MIAKASWFNNGAPFQMSASDAVIQGGKLSLIVDDRLQRGVTDWNQAVAFTARQEAQDYPLPSLPT